MADFDSKLPIRSLAADNTTEIADSAGATINPAKEDGNLATLAGTVSAAKVNENLSSVGGTNISLGQATMANSLPVAIASNQTDVPVNVTKVGGSALALGQATMAASVPVVLSSNQTAVPVTLSGSGTPSQDYKKATAIAATASDTHSYTPAGNISFQGIEASASGQTKVELQWGPTGSETSKYAWFQSKGDLKVSFRFPTSIALTSSDTIKVIVTNMDNQAQDLYSTILFSA